MAGNRLIKVDNLYKEFPIHKGFLDQLVIEKGRFVRKHESVKALSGVKLEVLKGESLCVVGESGCGKSTLARVVMGLIRPTQGEVLYQDQRIDNMGFNELLPYRKKMQMIFQNPYASLNPRMTVRQTLEEPISFHNPRLSEAEVNERVVGVTESVGVDPAWSDRYPHEFSGGQRQRISIARALAVDPEFIVADEPISALDVSIQAQVLNLLMNAREQRALTYLFITHDLAVVEHFGSRVAVMYLGTLCELAPTKKLFATPRHPYTQALLSAIPKLNQSSSDYIKLKGEVPTPVNLPSGCVFHGRCVHANERCKQEIPELKTYNDISVACHAVEEKRI
ncbi:MAG: ATP-binding cassette domain-containing protein [Arenicellales bacterium]|nr:ATP-binding cassette domain-containing protein [Arenicellales bacterium]